MDSSIPESDCSGKTTELHQSHSNDKEEGALNNKSSSLNSEILKDPSLGEANEKEKVKEIQGSSDFINFVAAPRSDQEEEEDVVLGKNQCLSKNGVSNSLNQIPIKKELEDDEESSSYSNNLDDESIKYLQERNGGSAATEQHLQIKHESDVETNSRSIGSDVNQQSSRLIYRCKYCGQQLQKIESLQRHEEAHRKGTIYKCRFCEYYSTERSRIAAHECKHTGEKPFACDNCEFRCASKSDLLKHGRVHDSLRPYRCKLCPHSAKSRNNLTRHMRSHSDHRPYSCDMCDWKFKTKSAWDNHTKLHSDFMGFFCDKCDYACKTSNLLRQHAITHSQERNFACSHPGCMQRCKTRSDLRKHMSVHKTGLDFKCVLCNKLFKSRHSLHSHTRRHENREYPCNICGKILQSNNSLKKHTLALHIRGKSIECLICRYKFTSKANLKTHLKVHASDRHYLCPICLHGFKSVNHLFTHIGTFHGKDYVYVCDICNRPFTRFMMMKFHIDRNHLSESERNIHKFIYDKNCSRYDADEFERKLNEMLKKEVVGNNAVEVANSNLYLEDVKSEMADLGLDHINALSQSQNLSASSTFCSNTSLSKNVEPENLNQDPDLAHSTQCERAGNTEMNCMHFDVHSDLKNLAIAGGQDLGNRTLTIKLERLDESIVASGKSNVETSQSRAPQSCAKVIRLGSYANVCIKLVGKDSGVKFNMKKGKKCKGWFAHPDNMLPEAREKTLDYLVKQANCTIKKKYVRRNVGKRGRNIATKCITPVSKRAKREKKSSSVSTRNKNESLQHIMLNKKDKTRFNLNSNVSSEKTVAVKKEVPDNVNDYSHHSSLQDNHAIRTEREFHQSNTEITNCAQFCPEIEGEHHGDGDATPNNSGCHSENPVEKAENAHQILSVRVEKKRSKSKKVGKKVSLSDNIKHQESVNCKKQRKICKSLKSKKGKNFPPLRIDLPNVMKNSIRVNEQFENSKHDEENQLTNQEPCSVLEVEKVIDSPLQITWKTVGGLKNSKAYKRLTVPGQRSELNSFPCTGKQSVSKDGHDVLSNSEPKTTMTSNSEAHYSMLEKVTDHNNGSTVTKQFEKNDDVGTISIDSQIGKSNLINGMLGDENSEIGQKDFLSESGSSSDIPLPVNVPSSEKKSNVKVLSLKEFEDEYRKRPKVVANVSLNSSVMKPVVQLSDVCRKRKSSPVNEKRQKKRLLLKIKMKNVLNEGLGHTSVSSDPLPTVITDISESVLSSVEGKTSFNSDDNANISPLHEDGNMSLRRVVEELKRNPEQFAEEPLTKSKRRYKIKGPRKCNKNISVNGKRLVPKINIALENFSTGEDVIDSNLEMKDSYSGFTTLIHCSENEKNQIVNHSDTQKQTEKAKKPKATTKLFKSVISPKQMKNKLPAEQKVMKEKSEKLKEASPKSMIIKKIAYRNKIKLSALFGNALEKNPHPLPAVQTNLSTTGSSVGNTNDLQLIQTSINDLKTKKSTKQGEAKRDFKSKISPEKKIQRKDGQRNKISSGPVKLKPKKSRKQQNGVKVCNKNNIDTVENRIKLPGLISTDVMERRLTVECVTLSPKVLLKKIPLSVVNCHNYNFHKTIQNYEPQDYSKGNVNLDKNLFYLQCGEDTAVTVPNEESSVKMETNVNDCSVADSNAKETVDQSLSFALFDNGNCIHGSRNTNEILPDVVTDRCSEDVLKREIQPYQTTVLVSNNCNLSHTTCDTHVMNESYSSSVDGSNCSCTKNDLSDVVNDGNVSSVGNNFVNTLNVISDTSVMNDDYLNAKTCNISPVKKSFSDAETIRADCANILTPHSPLPLLSPPGSHNSSSELVCTEELTDYEDSQLTVVVELGGDVHDVKEETFDQI